MESFREQRCQWCQRVFYICPCCDRGQVYCGPDCQRAKREEQVREAKRKYLTDEDVREGERVRQRERRARVRDQGSQKLVPDASVPIDAMRALMDSGGTRDGGNEHGSEVSPVDGPASTASSRAVPSEEPAGAAPRARLVAGEVRCAFCGRCARFVRFGPLRRWRIPRWKIRRRAP
ncbi:MAG TPA: hypothetical protein VFP84_29425 [Kofleriaceae bacterium]|nr:hypothetical protein [Kofleriaceae bacterium]